MKMIYIYISVYVYTHVYSQCVSFHGMRAGSVIVDLEIRVPPDGRAPAGRYSDSF